MIMTSLSWTIEFVWHIDNTEQMHRERESIRGACQLLENITIVRNIIWQRLYLENNNDTAQVISIVDSSWLCDAA